MKKILLERINMSRRWAEEKGILSLWHVALLILGYFLLRQVLSFFFYEQFPLYTDWEAFRSGRIFWDTLRSSGFYGFICSMVLIPFGLLYSENGWDTFEEDHHRLIITITVGLLAVQWGMVEYNFYLDQGFLSSRLLLVILPFLAYANPSFVVLFLMIFLPFTAQYEIPNVFLKGDYVLLLELLYLFSAFLLLRSFVDVRDELLTWSILVLSAGFLFQPFLEKVLASPRGWEWFTGNSLSLAFFRYHFLGWIKIFPGVLREWLLSIVHSGNKILLIAYALIHLAAVALPVIRKAVPLVLYAQMMFLGVLFVFTGELYWSYIILFGVLGTVLPAEESDRSFGTDPVLVTLSLVLVVFTALTVFEKEREVRPWETRYNQKFTIEAIDERGSVRTLRLSQFQPFLRHFGQSNHYLNTYTNGPKLVSTSADPAEAFALNSKSDLLVNISGIKQRYGVSSNAPGSSHRFDDFLRSFVQHRWEARTERSFLVSAINRFSPPNLINSYQDSDAVALEALERKPVQLRVRSLEAVVQNGKNRIFRDRVITRIPLDRDNP